MLYSTIRFAPSPIVRRFATNLEVDAEERRIAGESGLLSIFLLVHPTFSSAAQKKKQLSKRSGKTADKPAVAAYSFEPFQINVEKLPPNYRGHDIVDLYDKLAKKVGPKSEFETTAQYVARINSVATDGIYAFRIELDGPIVGPLFSYDADNQTLSMNIIPHKFGWLDLPSSNVNQSEELTGVGVRLRVTEKDEALYCISTYNRKAWPLTISVKATLQPDRARELMPTLGVLLISRLKKSEIGPLLVFESRHTGKSNYVQKNCVNVELLEIWIYDTKSGEIIKKEKIAYNPPFALSSVIYNEVARLINVITGEMLTLHKGDTILDTWRLEEIGDVSVKLTNLQSGTRHTVILERVYRTQRY